MSSQSGAEAKQWSPAGRRILGAAAELFARRGYFATTTRDIAAAVGVKQPAIYKHFATKDEILMALVALGLEYPLELASRLRTHPAPAAVRLYHWISRSLRHFQESPFVLASMLVTPELQQDQFGRERMRYRQVEQFAVDLISEGQRDGEFRTMNPVSAARLVLVLFDAMAMPETAVAPDEIAEFALVGLLSEPDRLAQVRRRAEKLADVSG